MGWRETAAATLADGQNVSDDGRTRTDINYPPNPRLVVWVERALLDMPSADRLALARELLPPGFVVAKVPDDIPAAPDGTTANYKGRVAGFRPCRDAFQRRRGAGMTALLPCPFCGGTRLVERDENAGHGMSVTRIACRDCDASGGSDYRGRKAMIAAWNRRAPSAEARAAEAAMREAVEAAYREGFEERGWDIEADADMCWRESNAIRALPLSGDEP